MIYLTGDTHIPYDISKLSTKNFPAQKELSKNDYVIICGDFGGVWNNDNEDLYWRKWLDDKSFTTLFIDGNHENFSLLKEFETVDFCSGKARRISDSIYHLMRGQIYDIDGNRFFTFGGATSHDKENRIKDKSWWEEELPSMEEMDFARENLARADWSVDYIVTHCAPNSVQQYINFSYKPDVLTSFLETVVNNTAFKRWFFGHYHEDRNIGSRFCCLYNEIIPLE